MTSQKSNKPSVKGFSLAEMLTVIAIILVITVVAVPNVVGTIASVRLRGSMSSVSGVFQNSRTMAVKYNRTMTTRFADEPHGIIAYVKEANDASPLAASDPQVQLQAPVSRLDEPAGYGAPPALDSATLGFVPADGEPSFNTRGMSCSYFAGNCISKGFVYYFTDTRPVGESGWAAISISPAGRVKRWFWSGTAWTD